MCRQVVLQSLHIRWAGEKGSKRDTYTLLLESKSKQRLLIDANETSETETNKTKPPLNTLTLERKENQKKQAYVTDLLS